MYGINMYFVDGLQKVLKYEGGVCYGVVREGEEEQIKPWSRSRATRSCTDFVFTTTVKPRPNVEFI